MAISALSADAFDASPTKLPCCAVVAPNRRDWIKIAAGAVVLCAAPWREQFDPEAWVERWYRLGNRVGPGADGQPMLWQNMDSDEAAAQSMRDELSYGNHRMKLIWYLRSYPTAALGAFTVYAGKGA